MSLSDREKQLEAENTKLKLLLDLAEKQHHGTAIGEAIAVGRQNITLTNGLIAAEDALSKLVAGLTFMHADKEKNLQLAEEATRAYVAAVAVHDPQHAQSLRRILNIPE
jgi:hypothetical protein